MPSVGRHALLTFKPVKPQYAEGSRTDPPVSLPVAQLANPLATATPEPEEDPPGTLGYFISQGFHGVPMCSFVPHPPKAHSTVLVLPIAIPPASSSRRTTVPVSVEMRCRIS